MSEYKRLINNNRDKYDPEYDFCIDCKYFGEPNGCNRPNGTCGNYDRFIETYNRLAELEDKIENGTLKEVVRCKDCVYFQPEYVEMENKKRRPYTEEEIKNGKFVSLEKGINCGSRCERFWYWEKNSYPVWFNENDFCSYGKPKPKRN